MSGMTNSLSINKVNTPREVAMASPSGAAASQDIPASASNGTRMNGILSRLMRPLPLARCTLPHRIIRSATYEGMAGPDGVVRPELAALYRKLVQDVPGTIITGFCAVSRQGRAMHPGQAGIWEDAHIPPWRVITEAVHAASPETKLFMQLAHAGRQTLTQRTEMPVKGASDKSCSYFCQRVSPLSMSEAHAAVADFGKAAQRAREAGFDGVQLHAAHGYLIHQFLSPYTNRRADVFRDPGLFLQLTVQAVRDACGPDFPILLKVSHADDRGLSTDILIPALRAVEQELDAVEVSYGSMEYALNIIRGDCPLDAIFEVNPLFSGIPGPLRALWKRLVFPAKRRRFLPFSPCYNVSGARPLQDALSVPVIPVGGIHGLADMRLCLEELGFPAVALCRPFICEPDLLARLRQGSWRGSSCTACNLCTVYCDSNRPLRCYLRHAATGSDPVGE